MTLAKKRRRKARAFTSARAAEEHYETTQIPLEKWIEAARLHAAPRNLSEEEATECGKILQKFALDWTSRPSPYDLYN